LLSGLGAFYPIKQSIGENPIDSLPLSKSYSGYRLEITDIRSIKTNGDIVIADMDIINSGKFAVSTGNIDQNTQNVVVLIDEPIIKKVTPNQLNALITGLFQSKKNFAPGTSYFKNQVSGNSATFESAWKGIAKSKNSTKTSVSSKPIVAVPNVIAPTDTQPLKGVSDKATVKIIRSNTIIQSTPELVKPVVSCGDLEVVNISIIDRKKDKLKISYTITNTGNAPIEMYGDKKSNIEPISIAVYFSASGQLSRGSELAGGDIILSGLDTTKGNLEPKAVLTGTLNISTKNKSRFLNTLILSVDSRQTSLECKENNNSASCNYR
jgi:hypothetical protein